MTGTRTDGRDTDDSSQARPLHDRPGTYVSWRWLLFVNVPIGLAVAVAAPRVLAETPGRRGRFDLPGALTGTAGIAALVYGPSNAATSANGVSHWGDAKVVASLAAAVVLLAAFAVIETRRPHALLPVRLLRDRNRSGAYLIMLGVGTAIFGMFFPHPVHAGGLGILRAENRHRLPPSDRGRPGRVGGRRPSVPRRRSRLRGGLQPAQYRPADRRLHRSRRLGTVAWTVVADSIHAQATRAATTAARAGDPVRPDGRQLAAIYHHALATGFARGFLVAAATALLTLAITIATIRVRRADLTGARQPAAAVPAEPARPR